MSKIYQFATAVALSLSVIGLFGVGIVHAAPQASDDSFTTQENQSVTISADDLLANDSNPGGGDLIVDGMSFPAASNGRWSIVDYENMGDGVYRINSVEYTPEPGYTGTWTFDYQAQDARDKESTDTASVEVTIKNEQSGQTDRSIVEDWLENNGIADEASVEDVTDLESGENGPVTHVDPDGLSDNTEELIDTLEPLSEISSLESLELGGTSLSESTSDLPDWQDLTELRLYDTDFGGDVSEFSSLPNLGILAISSTSISGNISGFSGLPNLWYLDLSDTDVSGDPPSWLVYKQDLLTLDIRGTDVTAYPERCFASNDLIYKYSGDPVDECPDSSDNQVTLTDTFRDTFEFTATITQQGGDNVYSYDIQGQVPNPNYSMEVSNNGSLLIAGIDREDGPARQALKDVNASGEFSLDSNEALSEIEFAVQDLTDDGGSDNQAPTARLSAQPLQTVDTGEAFTVTAEESSDPDGDELEYRWDVNMPNGSSVSGGFSDLWELPLSFSTPGTASFEVTVRDSDGNTDTTSITVEIEGSDDSGFN